jgi:hypothetical protein
MKMTNIFKIETSVGISHISATSRFVRSLMGVVWGDINGAATELTVIYDNRLITRSGIASALKSIGVICKIFATIG